MGKDVKVSGSGFGDVGGEESEMDLWDAVSLSSKKSSSSARGFGFSVKGFLGSEKHSSFMIPKRQEVMVMAACRCQLVSSISAVGRRPPPTPFAQPPHHCRLPALVPSLFLSTNFCVSEDAQSIFFPNIYSLSRHRTPNRW